MPSVNLVGFIPVNEMRDQPLQIRINETIFLGFPTSLPAAVESVAAAPETSENDDLAPLVSFAQNKEGEKNLFTKFLF
jgi:hypothetical protein